MNLALRLLWKNETSPVTKHGLIGLLLLAIIVAGGWFWLREPQPRIPSIFAASLPAECRQAMLVLSPHEASEQASLWLLERDGADWNAAAGPIAATLGHKGLAWGSGEHTAAMPAGFRVKREGDKCSPAGVFRIPLAFGTANSSEASWLRLPYTQLTSTIIGVDDPKSRHYNQIVDNTKVERDWDSNEAMLRHDRLYEWGAFIAHNPQCVPGDGSCIFLHLWPGPGKGTAGCTAMSAEDLRMVLAWLDPAKEPRLVQGLEEW